jgi:hypothetical protein
MLVQILEHTPSWVFILFAALLVLGLSQARAREVSRARATVLPLAMVLLSLLGVLSTFTQSSLALAAWIAGLGLCLSLLGGRLAIRGASWLAETDRFRVPGSWVPLILILGLFLIKYVSGVALALHPSLAASLRVALPLSLLYGAVAGLFWGRARSVLALRQNAR